MRNPAAKPGQQQRAAGQSAEAANGSYSLPANASPHSSAHLAASRAFALAPALVSQAIQSEVYWKLMTTVTETDCPALTGTAAGSPFWPSRFLVVNLKFVKCWVSLRQVCGDSAIKQE
jgi:hypothetical protein